MAAKTEKRSGVFRIFETQRVSEIRLYRLIGKMRDRQMLGHAVTAHRQEQQDYR